MGSSPQPFENFSKYGFLLGFPLIYLEFFLTMVHAFTHGLFDILLRVFTSFLIRKKFNELVMITEYFYKSL